MGEKWRAVGCSSTLSELLRVLEAELAQICTTADEECSMVGDALSALADMTARTDGRLISIDDTEGSTCSDFAAAAVATCVVGLQFNDRMIQGIAQVRAALASIRSALPHPPCPHCAGATQYRLRDIEIAYRLDRGRLLGSSHAGQPAEIVEEGDSRVELF